MEKANKKKTKKTIKKTTEPKFQMSINLDEEEPSLPTQKVEKIEDDQLKIIQVSYVKVQREETKEQAKEDQEEKLNIRQSQQISLQNHIQTNKQHKLESKRTNQQEYISTNIEQESVPKIIQQQKKDEENQKSILLVQQPKQKQSEKVIPSKVQSNQQELLDLSQGVSLNKPKIKKQVNKTKGKKKQQTKPSQKNLFINIQLEQPQVGQSNNSHLIQNFTNGHENHIKQEVPQQQIPNNEEVSVKVEINQQSLKQELTNEIIYKRQEQKQPIQLKMQEQTNHKKQIDYTSPKNEQQQVTYVSTVVNQKQERSMPSIHQQVNKTALQTNIEQDLLFLSEKSNFVKKDTKSKKKKPKAKQNSSKKQQISFDLHEQIIQEKPLIKKEEPQQLRIVQQQKQVNIQPQSIKNQINKTDEHYQHRVPIQPIQQAKQEIQDKAVQPNFQPHFQEKREPIVEIPIQIQNKQQDIQPIVIDVPKINEAKKSKKKTQATKKTTKQTHFVEMNTFIEELQDEIKKQQSIQKKQEKQQQQSLVPSYEQMTTNRSSFNNTIISEEQKLSEHKAQKDHHLASEKQHIIKVERQQQKQTQSPLADIIEILIKDNIFSSIIDEKQVQLNQLPKQDNQQYLQIVQLTKQKPHSKKKTKRQKKQKVFSKKNQILQTNFQLQVQAQPTNSNFFDAKNQSKIALISEQQNRNNQLIKQDTHLQQQRNKEEIVIQAKNIQQNNQKVVDKDNQQLHQPIKQDMENHQQQKKEVIVEDAEDKNNIITSLHQKPAEDHSNIDPTILKVSKDQDIIQSQLQFQIIKPTKKIKTKKKINNKNQFNIQENQKLLQDTQIEAVKLDKKQQIIKIIQQKKQQIVETISDIPTKFQQIKEIKEIVSPQKQINNVINFTAPDQEQFQLQKQKITCQIPLQRNILAQQEDKIESDFMIQPNDSKAKLDKNKKQGKKTKPKPKTKTQLKNKNIINENLISFQQPSQIINKVSADASLQTSKKSEPMIQQRNQTIKLTNNTIEKTSLEQHQNKYKNAEKLRQNNNVFGKKQIVNELINLIRFHNDEEIRIMRERMQMLQEDILSRMIRSKDAPRKDPKRTDYQWIIEENIALQKQYKSLNRVTIE